MKKKTCHSCVARRSVLHSANSLSPDINPVIYTRGALLSFVLVDLSLVPFWIWLNSAPRPALLGGLGGKGLDTDGRFVRGGGGGFLGRGGGDLGGGDATLWNWTAGRAVLSTDDRLPLGLRRKINNYRNCNLQCSKPILDLKLLYAISSLVSFYSIVCN